MKPYAWKLWDGSKLELISFSLLSAKNVYHVSKLWHGSLFSSKTLGWLIIRTIIASNPISLQFRAFIDEHKNKGKIQIYGSSLFDLVFFSLFIQPHQNRCMGSNFRSVFFQRFIRQSRSVRTQKATIIQYDIFFECLKWLLWLFQYWFSSKTGSKCCSKTNSITSKRLFWYKFRVYRIWADKNRLHFG